MKHLQLFFALLAFPFFLPATNCIPDCECNTDWTLEVRGAYYRPNSKKLKKIYSSCLIDYQITLAKRIHPYCEIWAEFDWTIKRSKIHREDYYHFTYGGYEGVESRDFNDYTKLSIIPISLGIKLIYPILPCVDVYAGAGASYSFLRIRNHFEKDEYSSDYYWSFSSSSSPAPFKKLIHKEDFGGLFKVGVQYAMSDSTFLDFFADYYLQHFRFSRNEDREDRSLFKHRLDCSGFKFGAGLGVYF